VAAHGQEDQRCGIVNNELFLAYRSDAPFTLCEICVYITEDRPGLLAVIANVFADHGINIVNVSINVREGSFHFIVDLARCMTPLDEVLNKIRSFSFVRGVEYRYMRSGPIVLARHIRPTFRGKSVVILDKDILQALERTEINMLMKVMYAMGVHDARYIRKMFYVSDPMIEDLLEILKIVQLRGFCRIERLELCDNNMVCSELSDCVDVDLVTEYIRGLLEELYRSKYMFNISKQIKDEHRFYLSMRFLPLS